MKVGDDGGLDEVVQELSVAHDLWSGLVSDAAQCDGPLVVLRQEPRDHVDRYFTDLLHRERNEYFGLAHYSN